MGISVRRLRGWEPRTVTEYEYDEDGRMVASVTSTEPEFTNSEVGILLASLALELELGPHGVPMHVASDPAVRDRIEVYATTDFVAQKLAQTKASYEKDYSHQDMSGIYFRARVRPETAI
jgi:hypothetical protein